MCKVGDASETSSGDSEKAGECGSLAFRGEVQALEKSECS